MPDTIQSEVVLEQAEILRERVIRTAWALHFAAAGAADVARDLRFTSEGSASAEESWWRLVSVRAIDLVHAWDAEARDAGRS